MSTQNLTGPHRERARAGRARRFSVSAFGFTFGLAVASSRLLNLLFAANASKGLKTFPTVLSPRVLCSGPFPGAPVSVLAPLHLVLPRTVTQFVHTRRMQAFLPFAVRLCSGRLAF